MNSCNPVFINVALKVGKGAYYSYLSALGISKKTGVDLPGEVNGMIHKISDVSDSTVATAAFGQGFTLNQLNMINAICTVANGGNLMKPHIVKRIVDKQGNTIQENTPTVIKQVFSKETSEKVLSMMESVVSEGTGKNAKVDGYYIAGKTSTSEQGRGANQKYSASFAALVPADDPQVAMLYTIYNPKGKQGHQGGIVAAPVAQNILSELLEYMEIPKSYETKDTVKKVTIPDVSNRTVGEAVRMLNSVGLKYEVDTSDLNAIVVGQMPMKGETVNEKSLVKLYLQGNDTRFNTTVPNVLNLDIVSATKKLSDSTLNIKISGSGMSVIQNPKAGTLVEQGTIVRVEFRPVGLDVE
jgi:stage V sporulation protein D (sporulation-specific penicillin-binding protein)